VTSALSRLDPFSAPCRPLLKLGFKISMCFSESCGGTFYCLVNTLDDRECTRIYKSRGGCATQPSCLADIARAVKPLDDWRYDQLKVFLGKISASLTMAVRDACPSQTIAPLLAPPVLPCSRERRGVAAAVRGSLAQAAW